MSRCGDIDCQGVQTYRVSGCGKIVRMWRYRVSGCGDIECQGVEI